MLAGGYDQIALVKELSKRGHQVILADYFSNPPAKSYASKHYQVSTLDMEAIKKIAMEESVQLITTVCTDQALLTVASVSEQLGLPCYVSSDTALNVTNKKYMKKIFKEKGIPTASYNIIEDIHEVENLKSEICYPIVVKPCDCNSSKGVVKVNNENELKESVKNAFELSRSHMTIIEEYLRGEEVSIDVWVDNEGAKVLSVSKTKKIKSNSNAFTIFRSQYPANLSEKINLKIQEVAQQITDAFQITDSPLLIQALISDDRIYVIEFSARMGGGTKYRFIEYMSGVDIMKVYVNRILGDDTQTVIPEKSQKHIEIDYIYSKCGQIKKISNVNRLLENNTIKEFYQYKDLGSEITKATTSSDRVAGILIVANSNQELIEKRKRAIEELDIYDNDGKSLMCKEMFMED